MRRPRPSAMGLALWSEREASRRTIPHMIIAPAGAISPGTVAGPVGRRPRRTLRPDGKGGWRRPNVRRLRRRCVTKSSPVPAHSREVARGPAPPRPRRDRS
jgi:hypothetical protein